LSIIVVKYAYLSPLHTPCLLKAVLHQLANGPVDFVPLIFCQAKDVEDDIVEGFTIRKRVGFLFTDRTGRIDAEFFEN
jgi:hypothetical protein